MNESADTRRYDLETVARIVMVPIYDFMVNRRSIRTKPLRNVFKTLKSNGYPVGSREGLNPVQLVDLYEDTRRGIMAEVRESDIKLYHRLMGEHLGRKEIRRNR